MACRLFHADQRKYASLILNQNIEIFIRENAFENVVCKMLTISSRLQSVSPLLLFPLAISTVTRIFGAIIRKALPI